MRNIYLSDTALADLERIGKYTVEKHGEEVLDRYLTLIDTAFDQIVEAPDRNGCKPSLKHLTKYHLNHAKAAAKRKGAAIHTPHHVVFFRVNETDDIEVVRILHDSMDFERHI